MGAEDHDRRSWGKPLLLLFLCYPLAFAGPLSLAIIPLLLWALYSSLTERNRILSAILLLANPLSVVALLAVVDYAKGAPRLQSVGLPSAEFWNIDRKTRCFNATSGCLVDEDEWVYGLPHNLTLYLLCSIFGPPSKSYDGPYPDKVAALRLVSNAPLQKTEDLTRCRLSVGTEIFELDPKNAELLTSSLGLFFPFGQDFDSELGQVQAVLFEQRCLILRAVKLDPFKSAESPEASTMVLLDRKNMRPFCYYQIGGNRMSRYPKLQYLPEHSR